MSKNKKSIAGSDELNGEVNISPLIDMVFILLIFFIVTTVFIEESGLAAQTPDIPTEQPPESTKKLTLLIKKTGQVFAQYAGDEYDIGLAGVRHRVQQEMSGEKYPIIVNVEPDSELGLYVQVHDHCMLAGANSITMKVISE